MDTSSLLDLTVRDIMSTELVFVNEDTIMKEVDTLLSVHGIHHLPVLGEDGSLKGMISRQDVELLKHWSTSLNLKNSDALNSQLLNSQLVSDRMTTSVVKVSPDDTLAYCADIFKENFFHGLPVVEAGVVIGIITTYDMIKVAFTKTPYLNKY